MYPISDFCGRAETPAQHLEAVLRAWMPASQRASDNRHLSQLLAHLTRFLPGVRALPLTTASNATVDILVEREHIIEVRHGFAHNDRKRLDHFLGKLRHHQHNWVDLIHGHVFIVITGESDPFFQQQLGNWIETANTFYPMLKPFHLIEKPLAKAPATKRR